jgi:hypothetical protein
MIAPPCTTGQSQALRRDALRSLKQGKADLEASWKDLRASALPELVITRPCTKAKAGVQQDIIILADDVL